MSSCCGTATGTVAKSQTTAAACCGDPTPNAATGACCSDPADSCSCQSSVAIASPRARDEHATPAASTRLPVAIIGAGPIGLAAAVHLVEKGETPLVLEDGDAVCGSIREWAHVRLCSPWRYLVDPAVRRLLEPTGWAIPNEDRLPTGGELVEQLLEPLAAHPAIAPHIRVGRRVVAVSRRGYDKVKSAGRDAAPFELVVRTADGHVERVLARAVIDASGTWYAANPMGAAGLVAEGEAEHSRRIRYGIPDVR